MTTPGVYPDPTVFAQGLTQGITITPNDWRCNLCHTPALPLRVDPNGKALTLQCRHPLPANQPHPVNRYTARYLIGQHILTLLGHPPTRPSNTQP